MGLASEISLGSTKRQKRASTMQKYRVHLHTAYISSASVKPLRLLVCGYYKRCVIKDRLHKVVSGVPGIQRLFVPSSSSEYVRNHSVTDQIDRDCMVIFLERLVSRDPLAAVDLHRVRSQAGKPLGLTGSTRS